MTTYRLASSEMVGAPGVIAWAINGALFNKRDRSLMVKIVADTWPTLPKAAAEAIVTKAVPYRVEDGAVVFEHEDPAAGPA
jgi:hypothetical protein